MASNVDSFMCSVLCWFVTFVTNWGMSSGHWFMGISAQAMPATHWEAELGRYVSVPNVCKTWGEISRGRLDVRDQRDGRWLVTEAFAWRYSKHPPFPIKQFARSAFSRCKRGRDHRQIKSEMNLAMAAPFRKRDTAV